MRSVTVLHIHDSEIVGTERKMVKLSLDNQTQRKLATDSESSYPQMPRKYVREHNKGTRISV